MCLRVESWMMYSERVNVTDDWWGSGEDSTAVMRKSVRGGLVGDVRKVWK